MKVKLKRKKINKAGLSGISIEESFARLGAVVGIQRGRDKDLDFELLQRPEQFSWRLRIGDQDINLFQGCNVTKELVIEFSGLNRIIPLVLKDARIGTPEERIKHAKHWKRRYLKLRADLDCLSDKDFDLYRRMKDWYNHVGNMLTYVNDVLHPDGFENIVKDDFATLRQMLSR